LNHDKRTELAVMSLSAREEQALECIADRLAGSDPGLAAMLATFTRLTSGEEMPAREEVLKARRRSRAHRLGHLGARRPEGGQPPRRHSTILWLPTVAMLIVGALIAVTAGLTSAASTRTCSRSLGLMCVSPVRTRPPAHPSQVIRIGVG
jgi:hypothetical protein